jgi:peptidyl-prolyl cis-trans isomerase C
MFSSCRRHVRFLFPLVLLFLLTACREQSEAVPQVLLTVDGRAVTLEQFRNSFAKTLPADQSLSPEEKGDLERSFLVQTVDRELTLAEASRLNIILSAEEVEAAMAEARSDYPAEEFIALLAERGLSEEQWRQDLEGSLLMEKVMRQTVYSLVTVNDESITQYYQENRDEFDRPEQVRARQIVVADEAEGTRLLGELRQGADFAAVAREHSLSPDAEDGGDLDFFARGEMPPEFDAVVFFLPEGQLSDLVKSEYGYHIFQVQDRRPAVRLSLEAVRDTIRDILRGQNEEQAYQEWLRGLRERASITINWSLLD